MIRTDHRIYLYCSPDASDDRCAQHVGHELAHILAHQQDPESSASSHDAEDPCAEDELQADREGRRLAERAGFSTVPGAYEIRCEKARAPTDSRAPYTFIASKNRLVRSVFIEPTSGTARHDLFTECKKLVNFLRVPRRLSLSACVHAGIKNSRV
ncbi:MAG: hypothetical protein ISN29_07920 [Gammaproteobacteria bacterium AqS3]|nr:hypothetical protein [Gammaproteobacteria bacterium AqS3]